MVSIMGLFFGEDANSQSFTITYRLCMFIFSIVMLFAHIKRYIYIPNSVRIYILFFSLFLLRALSDIFYNSDIQIISSEINRFLSFTFLIIIIPSITILYIREYINLNKAFYQVLFILSLSILLSYFNIEEIKVDERLELTNGLGVITTGHLASLQLILSFFSLKNKLIKSFFLNFLLIFISFLSLKILFLSGSRGPFLNLILTLIILNLKFKNLKYFAIITAILIFISLPIINFFIENIPIFSNRVLLSQGIGGRYFLYLESFDIIRSNPFFGKQFALIRYGGGFVYTHNIILDSMISLGIIGLTLILVTIKNIIKYSYKLIKSDSEYSWIGILLIMELLKLLLSSSFYQNERFTFLIIILFTLKQTNYKLNENTYFRTEAS
jgi:O-antigen ligase